MKKFKFPLQKLLDIRQAKEDEVRNELMKILSVQNRERVIQDELLNKINLYEKQQSEEIKKGIFSPEKIMSLMRYTDVSRRAIEESVKRAEAMEPEIQSVRERLIEASREKKIVEKLKERKRLEYDYEVNREIAKENDDMNQKIFIKRMSLEQ
jgi:flagellar FliJ protein